MVEAEAEVPRAMAEALREGKLGVMDYYNMQNVISDTRMRDSIARSGSTAGNGRARAAQEVRGAGRRKAASPLFAAEWKEE